MSQNAPKTQPAVGDTISTDAEYAALPLGSVIRNHQGVIAERFLDRGLPSWTRWNQNTGQMNECDHEAAKQLGEAVVVKTPDTQR